MTKIFATALLGGTLLLAGCATPGQPGSWDALVKQVQQIAAQACGFVPLAQTVVGIVTAGQFTEAFAIANAICAAVTAPPSTTPTGRMVRRTPYVGNVPVRGEWVVRR